MAFDPAAADLIAQQVEAGRHTQDRDESWIRLSSAGACPRQIGYRITRAEAEPEPLAALVVFEIGHAIHLRVQEWLAKLGWLRKELTEVPLLLPSERCRGTADGVSERLTKEGFPRSNGTRRVVEIKSIGNTPGEVFGKEMTGAFDRLEEPKGHHIDQATAYAWAWNAILEDRQKQLDRLPFSMHNKQDALLGNSRLRGLTWPEDRITHLTFVYVAKDGRDQDMPLKVFTQKVSEKRTARLVGKFRGIWEALDAGELPPRIAGAFGRYSPCAFCPYRGPCSEGLVDDDGEFYAEEGAQWPLPPEDEDVSPVALAAVAGAGDPGGREPEDEPLHDE